MSSTAVNQEECGHCFCRMDTAGNKVCCLCGKVQSEDIKFFVGEEGLD